MVSCQQMLVEFPTVTVCRRALPSLLLATAVPLPLALPLRAAATGAILTRLQQHMGQPATGLTRLPTVTI
jgi:hypothetical protein